MQLKVSVNSLLALSLIKNRASNHDNVPSSCCCLRGWNLVGDAKTTCYDSISTLLAAPPHLQRVCARLEQVKPCC